MSNLMSRPKQIPEARLKAVAKIMGKCVFGYSGCAFISYIREALAQLPEDVLDFVVKNCAIFSFGWEHWGATWPTDNINGRKWIILVSAELLRTLGDTEGSEVSEEDIRSIVAHQIAHAYLQHEKRYNFHCYSEEHERSAAALTKTWGFQGRGTHASSEKNENYDDEYFPYFLLFECGDEDEFSRVKTRMKRTSEEVAAYI